MDNVQAADPEAANAVVERAIHSVLFWRVALSDATRVAVIVAVLVFMRGVSAGLDELRTMRAEIVSQMTGVRMAIQLQGRELSRNLHRIDVNSSVLIDRTDTQLTKVRGQMKDVAVTAAIVSKQERKEITQAIQETAEAQREASVVQHVQLPLPAPVPATKSRDVPAPPEIRSAPDAILVPIITPVPPPPPHERQNVWRLVWNSVRRAF